MTRWGHPGRDKVAFFLGDIGLILLVTVASWYLDPMDTGGGVHEVVSLLLFLPAFLAAMYVLDLYNLVTFNAVGILIRASIAVGVAGVFSDVVSHFFGLPHFAFRWFAISLLILPIFTYALRRFYVHASRHLRPPQNIVVIGSVGDTEILVVGIERVHPRYRLVGKLHPDLALSHRLETQAHARPLTELRAARGDVPAWNFNSAGTAVAMVREKVSPADVTEVNRSVEVTPDLGPATRENLLRVVAECEVNVVVVRSEVMTIELAGTLTRLRFNGIQVYSMLDFCMHTSEELPLAILNEFWLCVADGFDLLQARFFRHLKRLIDIFLALVGLLVSLPLLLLAALAIRLDSPGPVLFRQRRIGWMGRPFELLKFRSMRAEAEKDSGPQWAAQDDPRITFVGNILRKTHFDELPQMINILRGQMSFVGPRPERPEFVGPLSDAINFYHLRHYVLPGITGWAQVNYPYGASLEDARRKLQYDLYYVCNASPLLDLRTLLRTARVVIFRQGSR